MKNFHVDVIHNGNIYYYYDVKAENVPTAREKVVEKYMRKYNVPQQEQRNIKTEVY